MTRTLGELRVRSGFNPSESGRVASLKESCAALIDEIMALPAGSGEAARLRALAATAVEEAAMWAVKCATAENASVIPDASG